MSKKKTPMPMIVGILILFLVPLSIGTAIVATFQAEENERQDIEETIVESSPFSDAKSKQSLKAVPLPQTGRIGSGTVENQTEGIPTGTYSNPPTSIGSFGSDSNTSTTGRPLADFDASTERNQSSQLGNRSIVPDYSSPSASNNFNSTENNSLIDPLEDDSFLEVPRTNNSSTSVTPPINSFGN